MQGFFHQQYYFDKKQTTNLQVCVYLQITHIMIILDIRHIFADVYIYMFFLYPNIYIWNIYIDIQTQPSPLCSDVCFTNQNVSRNFPKPRGSNGCFCYIDLGVIFFPLKNSRINPCIQAILACWGRWTVAQFTSRHRPVRKHFLQFWQMNQLLPHEVQAFLLLL